MNSKCSNTVDMFADAQQPLADVLDPQKQQSPLEGVGDIIADLEHQTTTLLSSNPLHGAMVKRFGGCPPEIRKSVIDDATPYQLDKGALNGLAVFDLCDTQLEPTGAVFTNPTVDGFKDIDFGHGGLFFNRANLNSLPLIVTDDTTLAFMTGYPVYAPYQQSSIKTHVLKALMQVKADIYFIAPIHEKTNIQRRFNQLNVKLAFIPEPPNVAMSQHEVDGAIKAAIDEANNATWGELTPLAQVTTTTATPYPIHAFPQIAQDAIKQAAHYNHVPLALAGQTALGLMVYIAQEHAQAPSDKTTKGQPCSFGIFSVFESGGGKDETRNLLAKSIADKEDNALQTYLDDKRAHRALSSKERSTTPPPANPITLYKKGTTQGIVKAMSNSVMASFAWQTTEGAMVLGGYSLTSDTMGESLGVINNLIDAGTTTSILHGNDEPEIVIGKRFSVDLSIQEVMAKKSLHNEALRLQGFLARFLFAAPEPLPMRQVTKEMRRVKASEDAAIIAFNDLCERLKYPPNKEHAPYSDERILFLKNSDADTLHIDFENHIKAAAGKGGKYHSIRPNALRMIQYSLRVATVLAYFNPELDCIDANTMQGAIDLCTYSLDEWIRYYSKDDETDSDLMLKWLVKQKEAKVLKSSISTHATPQKLRNKNIRDDVLTTLCDCNYARLEKLGGKDYVVLNPSLTG